MKNTTFKNVTYVLIVVCLNLTIIQGYFPFFRRIWLIITIAALLSLILAHGYFRSKSLPFLILYIVFVFFNLITGDFYFGKIGNVMIETSSLLLVCSMFWETKNTECFKTQELLVVSFAIVLIITALGSYWADTISPGIMRHAFGDAAQGGEKDELLYYFYKMGMSDYMLPHAVPVIIPGVVYGLKKRSQLPKFFKVLLWITIISLMLLAYLSGATTALILAIISLLISVSLDIGNPRNNLIRIVVLLVIAAPVLLSDTVQLSILDFFDRFTGDGSYFQRKIELFRASILNEDTNVMETREYLYKLSFNEFLKNPILGTNSMIGGHSSFLDRLSSLGIIGIIPFVLFIFAQYNTTKNTLYKDDVIFFIVGFLMGILMCCVKSAWNWYTHFSMFVFLPISIMYFRQLAYNKTKQL